MILASNVQREIPSTLLFPRRNVGKPEICYFPLACFARVQNCVISDLLKDSYHFPVSNLCEQTPGNEEIQDHCQCHI
jgi:hypothetical protein